MTYDETTKTLTASEGKVLKRTEDGTLYGSRVRLGYSWYINGKKLDTPHEDAPGDFEEVDDPHAEARGDSKERLKAVIEAYDSSEAVDSFTVTIGGTAMTAWLTNAERTSYTASVSNAELLGEETVDLLLNGKVLTLPTSTAKVMLARISRYADKCWMVTQQHLLAVEALTDEAEIEAYDYREGYPERLSFEI